MQAADNAGGSGTSSLSANTYLLTIPATTADDPRTGDLDRTFRTAPAYDGALKLGATTLGLISTVMLALK